MEKEIRGTIKGISPLIFFISQVFFQALFNLYLIFQRNTKNRAFFIGLARYLQLLIQNLS